MNEQELQQAFIQWLAQKLGVQDENQLKQAVQEMGQEGLQQAYQQFMQEMQQQQAQKAKFGAKLNYIKGLNGQCPEGTEMQYFKEGGTICKKCVAKQKNGGKEQDSVEQFKCGRKVKKAQSGVKVQKGLKTPPKKLNDNQLIDRAKDGTYIITTYPDRASADSVWVNNSVIEGDLPPGKMVRNSKGKMVWAPDRTKPPYRKVKK